VKPTKLLTDKNDDRGQSRNGAATCYCHGKPLDNHYFDKSKLRLTDVADIQIIEAPNLHKLNTFDTSQYLGVPDGLDGSFNERDLSGLDVNYHNHVIRKVEMNHPNKQILSKLHGDDYRPSSK
jgi:hypothetical protein